MSPHYDLDLEDGKPMFLFETLAHDDTSPYQVWLQKVRQLRRCGQEENSIKFWTFAVTFTLSIAQQSNLFTRQASLWWCAINPKFGCKRISSSEGVAESHILITWAFTVTLTWRREKQPFCMTLWLMMHHHTMSGDKWISISKDIVRTTFMI